jgi:uncharacterized membrane protein YdjX (TVP38/TMEM64 family)
MSTDEPHGEIAAAPREGDSSRDSVTLEVRRAGWLKIAIGLVAAVVLLVLAVAIGPDIGEKVVAMERWIAGHGVWGPVIYIGVVIVLTSMFFPDTALAAAAGVMFGLVTGSVVMIIGSVVTQGIAFGISRYFLSHRVRRALNQRPKLAAIERAVNGQGLRLQLMLRLTPLNPVAISHVIGVTRIGFPTFLVACAGLIPGMIVEVYFGYTAKHMLKVAGNVHEHSTLHTAMTISGLVVCVLMMMYVTRMARKALAESEQQTFKEHPVQTQMTASEAAGFHH